MVIMYAQSSTLRKNAFDALKRVSFMVFRRCKSYHPRTSFCAAFVDVGGGGGVVGFNLPCYFNFLS